VRTDGRDSMPGCLVGFFVLVGFLGVGAFVLLVEAFVALTWYAR
jgi:hypothetical protein